MICDLPQTCSHPTQEDKGIQRQNPRLDAPQPWDECGRNGQETESSPERLDQLLSIGQLQDPNRGTHGVAEKTLEDEADAGVEELASPPQSPVQARVHRRLQENLHAEVEKLCQSAYFHGSSKPMV